MNMHTTLRAVLFTCIISVTAVAGQSVRAADKPVAVSAEKAVAYTRVSMTEYQNFLKNWDDDKQPLLYALIKSPAQYDALFAPAAFMGGNRPFAPEAGMFDKEMLLLVARVISSTPDRDKVFEVERIAESSRMLLVYYRFNAPKTKATSSEKNFLAVKITKNIYNRVSFFENGKPVGNLDIAKGEWSVPKTTAKLQ